MTYIYIDVDEVRENLTIGLETYSVAQLRYRLLSDIAFICAHRLKTRPNLKLGAIRNGLDERALAALVCGASYSQLSEAIGVASRQLCHNRYRWWLEDFKFELNT